MPGEVSLPGGSPCWGGLPAQGGLLARGCLLAGGSPCQGGLLTRGGSPCWGVSLPPSPTVNRITHSCKNITLATTALRPVIIYINKLNLIYFFSNCSCLTLIWFDLTCVILFVKLNPINLKGCKQSLIKFQIISNANKTKQNQLRKNSILTKMTWNWPSVIKNYQKRVFVKAVWLYAREDEFYAVVDQLKSVISSSPTKRSLFLKPKCLSHGHGQSLLKQMPQWLVSVCCLKSLNLDEKVNEDENLSSLK